MLFSTVFAVGIDPQVSRPAPQRSERGAIIHDEVEDQPYRPRTAPPDHRSGSPQAKVVFGPYVSVQVNVNPEDQNILGDAANEPSIAIDPTDPSRVVIGWRQFDTIESNFRQAGWAWSHDTGGTWTFPGVLEPGVFRSDPVLDVDSDGSFYYYSIRCACQNSGDLFKSKDGGLTWNGPVFAFGADKPWMIVDRTSRIGSGNIYVLAHNLSPALFTRSTDAGKTFSGPFPTPPAFGWFLGTLAVGSAGNVYAAGWLGTVAISDNAQDPDAIPSFDIVVAVDFGGEPLVPTTDPESPNPGGIVGQPWIALDHSATESHGNVYILHSIVPEFGGDPHDVTFIRSTDGGFTWSEPVRVNDDDDMTAWQWFGTMAVAPNGRIDAVWNDTRNTGLANLSELYYAYSSDAGVTWSKNIPVSPVFDSHVGWPPAQAKIGDYYDMISDDTAANVAYAATFNDEQDVYFLRIGFPDADSDRDVDLRDFAGFQNCFTGEGGGVSAGCTLFDVDRDTDVDATDYIGLSNLLVGP